MQHIVLTTRRLRVSPCTMQDMKSLYEDETDEEMKKAYGDMIDEMQKIIPREEWGTEWTISLCSGERIGGIGFKGIPDIKGSVEIGYGINEEYQKNGYATEAVECMVKWALAQEGVVCVIAQTEENNMISQKVLMKNGFIRDGYGEEGPLFRRIDRE